MDVTVSVYLTQLHVTQQYVIRVLYPESFEKAADVVVVTEVKVNEIVDSNSEGECVSE